MLLRVLFVTKGRCLRTFDKIKFVGYAFQIEMKYRTFVKFSIVEVPIILQTEPKESKMSNSIIVEAVLELFHCD
jgi:hypothetical protein